MHKKVAHRDERHLIFSEWIINNLLSDNSDSSQPQHQQHVLLDVAGGKGRLAEALVSQGFTCALVVNHLSL